MREAPQSAARLVNRLGLDQVLLLVSGRRARRRMGVDDDALRVPAPRRRRSPSRRHREPRRHHAVELPAACASFHGSPCPAGRSRREDVRSSPPAAPPGSPLAGGTRNSVAVTRFTFTSVVCAEASPRRAARRRAGVSAIVASWCSRAGGRRSPHPVALPAGDATASLRDEMRTTRTPRRRRSRPAGTAAAAPRRRCRAPGSRRTRTRSASAGTPRNGGGRSPPRAEPRARRPGRA